MTYSPQRRGLQRRRWARPAIILVLVGLVGMAIPRTRVATLQALGQALIANDPVSPADVIVISVDADSAGVLEAADLVRSGISKTVAVFGEPPRSADLEFQRRGIPHDDEASRALEELQSLGIVNPVRIPTAVNGTTAEGRALSSWVGERGFRSILLITTADHSRRTRRVIRRALKDQQIHIAIRASRYSDFDPAAWWQSRTGVRTEIIELQKLLLDILRHPLS